MLYWRVFKRIGYCYCVSYYEDIRQGQGNIHQIKVIYYVWVQVVLCSLDKIGPTKHRPWPSVAVRGCVFTARDRPWLCIYRPWPSVAVYLPPVALYIPPVIIRVSWAIRNVKLRSNKYPWKYCYIFVQANSHIKMFLELSVHEIPHLDKKIHKNIVICLCKPNK